MPTKILDSLPDERVLFSNSLATVTRNCIVLKDGSSVEWAMISLSQVTRIRKISVTYPVFLIIGIAVLIVAAAALMSKDGDGAGLPILALGLLLIFLYWGSRRGAVQFTTGDDLMETVFGSPREAAALIKAVDQVSRPHPAPELLQSNSAAS